ncbi:imelysin family protein [Rhodovibrionaceae bacterium A322]
MNAKRNKASFSLPLSRRQLMAGGLLLGAAGSLPLASGWIGSAKAADDPALAHQRLNESLLEAYLLPRYGQLVTSTAALQEEATAFCAVPSPEGLQKLQMAFHQGLDSWMAVEHLRFGPGEFLMRPFRFTFWPDKRNSVGRDVSEALQAQDPAVLEQQKLSRSPVSLQGFSALERLIFGDKASKLLLSSSAEADYACKLVRAITVNLATMARNIEAGWLTDEGPFVQEILKAGNGSVTYETPTEATVEFFKSLHGGLQMVSDMKLARPLGSSLKKGKAKRVENWRSERGLKNIQINLQALEELYRAGSYSFEDYLRERHQGAELADLLDRAFKQIDETVTAINLPLSRAVKDPDTRLQAEALRRETNALREVIAKDLSVALDLPLGFNALDGD